MKHIGILGGSFNPVHYGHLMMAQTALEALKLDKVLFIPANTSPFKTAKILTTANERLDMLRLATQSRGQFVIYDGEIKRGGISYTVDTLRILHEEMPSTKFYLIMGRDTFVDFGKWQYPQEIVELASLVVINRPGFDQPIKSKFPHKCVDMTALDIASTEIRKRVKTRKSITYLTPDNVIDYINRRKLYL